MSRARAVRTVAATSLALAALTTYDHSAKGECKVGVNGAFGSAATVDVNRPPAPRNVVKDVLIKEKGNAIDKGQTALLRVTSFDSRSGKIVSAYNSGDLRPAEVSKKGLGDIADDPVGVKERSRLVFRHPRLVDGNRQNAEIIVVDVFSTIAQGRKAPAPDPAPSGVPSLFVANNGGPVVKASGQPAPELTIIPFVEGSGDQVSKGDTLAVQYAIYDTEGRIVDTTWSGGKLVKLKLDKAVRRLAEGLVDQKVESRVVILISASFTRGEDNRTVVVDILGTLSSSPGKEETVVP